MEHLGGVKSDEVVFSILFDVAIKSSQFTVAERLLEEMKKRGLEFKRFGKVSKIQYYGMQEDAVGVQRSFDEFVSSGEIVDTVVMNCVMTAFIRAGEVETAKQLYAKMMEAEAASQAATGPSMDPKRRRESNLRSEMGLYRNDAKKLGRVLQGSAALKGTLPDYHRALQDSFRAVPDTRTFHIFLSLHANTTADINGFKSILADMEKAYVVPPRGMIFLLYFSGFARNGRYNKGWTAEQLQETWKSYLRALHESSTRLTELYRNQQKSGLTTPFLGGTSAFEVAYPSVTREPSDFNTTLPTSGSASKGKSHEVGNPKARTMTQADGKPGADNAFRDMEGADEEIEEHAQHRQHSSEEIETRIENGVFLGRRMIVTILRAFGACCGPDEIMKVWLQMERIWQPRKRKALDVMITREELEKQMNRTQRRS
ncbi:hypothetical protein BO70DRAFT_361000 [Aspergillus heteromorphus CBS 117.55]|uniref:Pentatricopeptide repeat protein n=1 Tax=Aspergillus heteromorphus CBS 117.55 TaxID=1448321 RepID=A0A317WIP6_9EURO|nr:uncharacterized protein BO70DRAFT_361000 [Aspergillus heteromorphus CBS 117.55]PWY86179.1 hypothetical protein BO70DRAFT_361000 [Aspergillus heteromorphus CBS 117.55]